MIYAVWAHCSCKYTGRYEALAQIDCASTGQMAVEKHVSSGCFYPYMHPFGHVFFTVIVLQNIVLNDVIMNVSTKVAIYITLHDIYTQHVSCVYVLLYGER